MDVAACTVEGLQRTCLPLMRVFQREAGTGEYEERQDQQSVAEALVWIHADSAMSGWRRGGVGFEAAGPQLEDPVAGIVQQHQSDGAPNHQQVEDADEGNRVPLTCARPFVDLTECKAR